MRDPFYVGYETAAPPELSRFLGRLALGVGTLLVCVVGVCAALQLDPGDGMFEWGTEREFEGRIYADPVPVLVMDGTNATGSRAAWVVVGAGKHGVGAWLRDVDGQRVRLRGTRITGGGTHMVEILGKESVAVLNAERVSMDAGVDAGEITLRGELVDTKCHSGVMRPGAGKVHRGCAVRCLSGGVPPGLLVRDGDEVSRVVMLEASRGRAMEIDPALAARSMEASGRLRIVHGLPYLEVKGWRVID